MIVLDTEYTTWPGALESGWTQPGQHREIVQIAAILVNDQFEEVDRLDVLVRPTINPILSDLFVSLTGITQEMVDRNGKPFNFRLQEFTDFCAPAFAPIICMNADETVFRENCSINGIEFRLPSFHRVRPFAESLGFDLTHLSSGQLHTLTPEKLEGHTHNALHDVRSMACFLRSYVGDIQYIHDLPTGAPDRDPRSVAT